MRRARLRAPGGKLKRVSYPVPSPSPSEIGKFARRPIAGALAAVHSHPRWASIAVVVYAAAVTFPHADVQWAVNEIAIRITHPNLYRLAAGIVLAQGAVLTTLLWRGARGQSTVVWRLWFLTLALILGAWSALTANNVELVHYPQYFPEGMALAALTLSPAEALSWIVFFGGLDEGYQYWVLSKGRPTLLDFNDIYMDLLGGAAGVVFAMAFLHTARHTKPRRWIGEWKRPGVLALLSVTALGFVLWASRLMLIVEDKANTHYWLALGRFRAPSFWAHIIENGPKHYHTLTPVEGSVVIWTTIAVYAFLCRRCAPEARRPGAMGR